MITLVCLVAVPTAETVEEARAQLEDFREEVPLRAYGLGIYQASRQDATSPEVYYHPCGEEVYE